MKNKTDIDALEKAVGILDNDYLDGYEIVTLQLSIKDFIHQYKQEIHIAVETDKNYKQLLEKLDAVNQKEALDEIEVYEQDREWCELYR